MRSNLLPPLALVLLIGMALSGCLATTEEPSTTQGTQDPAPTHAANATQPAGEGEEPAEPEGPAFEAPVVAVEVSVDGVPVTANGSVFEVPSGTPVVFNATNSTDPAGGNLSAVWTVDGYSTEGLEVSFEFAEGMANVSVAVSSDVSNRTAELVVALTVFKGARQPVSFTDDTGDGAPNYGDLKDVTVSDDGTDLIILFHTAAVQPSSSTYTVFCYNFYIADTRYETYSLDGYYVYDYDKQGDVDGASMRLSSTGFEVRLPLSELDLEFPMTFYMTSRIGECAIRGGAQELDRAPNDGTVTYG